MMYDYDYEEYEDEPKTKTLDKFNKDIAKKKKQLDQDVKPKDIFEGFKKRISKAIKNNKSK